MTEGNSSHCYSGRLTHVITGDMQGDPAVMVGHRFLQRDPGIPSQLLNYYNPCLKLVHVCPSPFPNLPSLWNSDKSHVIMWGFQKNGTIKPSQIDHSSRGNLSGIYDSLLIYSSNLMSLMVWGPVILWFPNEKDVRCIGPPHQKKPTKAPIWIKYGNSLTWNKVSSYISTQLYNIYDVILIHYDSLYNCINLPRMAWNQMVFVKRLATSSPK